MRKLSTTEWIAVAVALVVVASFAMPGWFGFFLGPAEPAVTSAVTEVTDNTQLPATNQTTQNNVGQNISTVSGLQIYDTTPGTGPAATPGQSVTVNYVGTLTDGTKFDSSYDRNEPFTFTLGAGQVIQGWDEGLVGMKVGGTRRLVISPALGYGSNQVGPIPPNSTLIFDVTLLGVK